MPHPPGRNGPPAPPRGPRQPGSRHRPSAQGAPGPRRASPEAPSEARVDLSKYVDVLVVLGVDQGKFRITREDHGVLLHSWILSGEDVVLSVHYKTGEEQFVLRGSSSARIQVSAPDPSRRHPLASVRSTEDIREAFLAQVDAQAAEGAGGP